MPDTIRTLQELNVIFQDQVNNEISPQDIRDLTISFLVYGEIGCVANITAQSLGVGYQRLEAFDIVNGINRGVTFGNSGEIIVPVDGKYSVEYSLDFTGTFTNTFDFAISKNNSELIAGSQRSVTVPHNNQKVCVAGSVYVSLNQNDYVTMVVRSNNNSITCGNGALRVERRE